MPLLLAAALLALDANRRHTARRAALSTLCSRTQRTKGTRPSSTTALRRTCSCGLRQQRRVRNRGCTHPCHSTQRMLTEASLCCMASTSGNRGHLAPCITHSCQCSASERLSTSTTSSSHRCESVCRALLQLWTRGLPHARTCTLTRMRTLTHAPAHAHTNS